MSAPTFTFDRGRAVYGNGSGPALQFDQLHSDRRTGDVHGEVVALLSGHPVHQARLNLLSTRTKAELAKHLATRTTEANVDWISIVEDACSRTIAAVRTGQPALLLRDAEEPKSAGFALSPLLLARDPVILFGDGGSLKSYLSLAAAVALHSGIALVDDVEPARSFRVAYLDFEWNAWPHKRRLRALCGGGQLPEIVYVPCQTAGPLSHQVDRLQRIFAEHRIEYAFIDSVGLATDGPPEEAQSALGFFQALARLEVGSCLIAHTNREGDTSKPFGSAFWHNSARLTWYIKRERGTPATVDVGLYNRKANDGPLRSDPLGLRFKFNGTDTSIEPLEVADVPELESAIPARDRMAAALKLGARTAADLADELGVPVNTVIQTAKRWDGKLFTKVINADGIHRIGLVTGVT